jgi:hypothetical protein
MGNLYSGSIFSSLTADISPIVPKTLVELLHSELSIVTTRIATSNYTHFLSLLKESVIPSTIFGLSQNSSFSKLLLKLEEKSVFIRSYYVMDSVKIIKNINASEPLSYLNNSVSTQNTFALIDLETNLNRILVPVKILAQRHIVENRDDLAITSITCGFSGKNFLSRKIFRGILELTEAGISTKWRSLTTTETILRYMFKIDNITYPSSFAKLMFKPRDPIVFSENQPISMKIMQYFLAVCLLLPLAAGGLVLLLEFTISGQMLIFLKKLYFSIILLFYKFCRNLSNLIRRTYFVLCNPTVYWKKRRVVDNRS